MPLTKIDVVRFRVVSYPSLSTSFDKLCIFFVNGFVKGVDILTVIFLNHSFFMEFFIWKIFHLPLTK